MQAIRKATVEVLVLSVLGAGLALTFNAVRGSSGLELTKNYFDKRSDLVAQKRAAFEEASREAAAVRDSAELVELGVTPEPASDDHPDHGLQELSFDDVVKVYNDPNTKLGVNIFVDARRDDQFEEGHIPGAILCNPFQLEDYIELVLDFAEGAEKIIVYCNGGDCEDSISLCGELLEFDVPYESIFLYAAGWKAWKAGNMPVETGMGGE